MLLCGQSAVGKSFLCGLQQAQDFDDKKDPPSIVQLRVVNDRGGYPVVASGLHDIAGAQMRIGARRKVVKLAQAFVPC